MARPERNNVDYFPFMCDEGKKMYYIEEKYGNDGFAVFVKLLRELARANYHYLDLSEKSTTMFLSAKCKVEIITLENIIKDLVDLGKFHDKLWNEKRIIWCQDFIDSIQDAYIKRKNKCVSLLSLLHLLQGLGVLKQGKSTLKGYINTQSRVEYSKEENSIVDESTLYNLDKLKELYVKDDKLFTAVLDNNDFKNKNHLLSELDEFNLNLSQGGVRSKKYLDYCSHFLNWYRKKPKSKHRKSSLPEHLTEW